MSAACTVKMHLFKQLSKVKFHSYFMTLFRMDFGFE